MWLRNYPTRRKLLKDVENLRAENRHLSIELRNARADLALEQITSSGYRHENRKLRSRIEMLCDDTHSGFTCLGVTGVAEE